MNDVPHNNDIVDLTQPHEPIEGVDFDWIREIQVHDVPVEVLLSSEASELYKGLLDTAGNPISLDEVLETLARLVKMSIAYDFENAKAKAFYSKGGSVPEIAKHAKLKGVCTEGPPLGIALLNSLGIEGVSAEALSFHIPNGAADHPDALPGRNYSHAVMGVGYDGGYKIVNTVSAKLAFGLVRSKDELDACGKVHSELGELVMETLYSSGDNLVVLQPRSLKLKVVEDTKPDSLNFGKQLLVLGDVSKYPMSDMEAIPFCQAIALDEYPSRKFTLRKPFAVFRVGVEVVRRRFGKLMAQCIHTGKR
jgi:hypothetical protein